MVFPHFDLEAHEKTKMEDTYIHQDKKNRTDFCGGAEMTRRSLQKALISALAATTLPLPAQAAELKHQRPKSLEIWRRTELYFGSERQHQPPVTGDEFTAFLNAVVTPRFPDGLTVLTGYGQFKNSLGVTTREQSMVLILLYPPSDKEATKRIEEIREQYKLDFQQESVLRVDTYAAVSF
jgi:hypothetical protein